MLTRYYYAVVSGQLIASYQAATISSICICLENPSRQPTDSEGLRSVHVDCTRWGLSDPGP